MTKWVYAFGDGKAEGRADMRNLLGGKGANLAEMSNLGLPVPPGLTVTTGAVITALTGRRSASSPWAVRARITSRSEKIPATAFSPS